jgi:hypothetical protein
MFPFQDLLRRTQRGMKAFEKHLAPATAHIPPAWLASQPVRTGAIVPTVYPTEYVIPLPPGPKLWDLIVARK